MYTSKLNIKHNRHTEIHWGVHKETGELIWIDDVDRNGFACNCKCACCGVDLKACAEGKLQQHHFKHRANNSCYYSDEIAEYLKACELLGAMSEICLPPVGIRIGKRGEVITPASELTIQNVFCHHDDTHYPPLLMAEIDGQATRIVLSFDGYYDKSDYNKFFQEAHQNKWNCLAIILPQIGDSLSITKENLWGYVSGMNTNKSWIYHTKTAEWAQRLKDAAVKLTPTEHRYGAITHIEYSCPLHKREYNRNFYAFKYDCQDCEFNLAIPSVCLCLAEAQIKSLSDFDIPIEERKARFAEMQKMNEESIAAQRALKVKTTTTNIPPFNPQTEPGYSDVCNRNPNDHTAVYDRLRKRWYWCIDCNSWMPQRNMAGFGFNYGTNKGQCKDCNRKKLSTKRT